MSEITDILESLGENAKSRLKFDPSLIRAALNGNNTFRPDCAKGKMLGDMIANNQIARVYQNHSNYIWLDCRPSMYRRWRELFDSENPRDFGLFVHEALRVIDPTRDDDITQASASYYEALNMEIDNVQLVMDELILLGSRVMKSGDPRCRLWIGGNYFQMSDQSVLEGGRALYYKEFSRKDWKQVHWSLRDVRNNPFMLSEAFRLFRVYKEKCTQNDASALRPGAPAR